MIFIRTIQRLNCTDRYFIWTVLSITYNSYWNTVVSKNSMCLPEKIFSIYHKDSWPVYHLNHTSRNRSLPASCRDLDNPSRPPCSIHSIGGRLLHGVPLIIS